MPAPRLTFWRLEIAAAWICLAWFLILCRQSLAQLRQSVDDTGVGIELAIFGRRISQEAAHARLDDLLETQLQQIDYRCQLSSEQLQKLRLAGAGDINRFFRKVDDFKRSPNYSPDSNVVNAAPTTASLQVAFRGGVFQEDSLLRKCLPSILDAHQLKVYSEWIQQSRIQRHEVGVNKVVAYVGTQVKMSRAERELLAASLAREIPLAPTDLDAPTERLRLIILAGKLAEQQPTAIPDAKTRKALIAYASQYRRMEPVLRKQGYLPTEEDK